MPFAESALQSQTFSSHDGIISVSRVRRRVLNRRRSSGLQVLSYALGALILALYVHAGTIPLFLPPLFLLSGSIVIGAFLVLSETHFNDRFREHYLELPQVIAHVAVQYTFLVLAPQIGYAFLAVVFLIVCTGALRMTSKQSTITWLMMTLGAVPIFLTHLPIGIAMTSPAERMASLLAFVATVGQCMFVGLYGSSLRNQLYKSGVELRLAYSRIEQLANVDELTGALNRRSIMRTLDDEIVHAQRTHTLCSVALIDLDWFKRVNDLFGHPTGDEVLRTFAVTIFANIRDQDKFGRYGGEEFLLVMPDTTADVAQRLLDRLRLIISELDWSAFAPAMTISISAGHATLKDDENADALLARADAALYAAKRGGRNRVEAASERGAPSLIPAISHEPA